MAEHGWVALLRGINVGGKNKVPMAELRRLFEETGCGSVSSYIQSGNVLFTYESPDRAALARQLERAVEESFGVANPIVLRTFAELGRIVRGHPFGADSSQTYVAFLVREPEDAHVLESLDVAPDRFEVVGDDVYLYYPNGVTGARLGGAVLERRLGVAATLRNWRTVTRLAELADSLA
jgi:uncharacterized protein (DUF1697 family)